MTVKNKVVVKILGQEYTLISDDSREHMQRVSNLVDDKMRELYNSNKKMSTSMVAVLTALNMTDEYLKAVDEQKAIIKRYENPKHEIDVLAEELLKVKETLTEREMATFGIEKENTQLAETLQEYEKTILQLRNQLDDNCRESEEKCKELSTSSVVINELKSRIDLLEQTLNQKESTISELSASLSSAKSELKEFVDTFEENN
ncbi:MAG: cell division protein ZapA [Clostridia bacterium]|nr:cell division protein ZapA [Clostridia bacterium]